MTRAIGRAAAFLLAVLLVFALVEGLASLARFGALVAGRAQPPLAERAHTRYDPELGWVARSHLALPDAFGPGIALHTNAQGFRGATEVTAAVPPGVVRVLCSGDSFALGYGVGDEAAWCHQLARLAPDLETVNLGQSGYGLDQAFLWFRRDGASLAHHVHLFTFIDEDFVRMGATTFFGYGKPRLALDGETLVVENVPVPRAAYRLPWLARNAHLAAELRAVQIGRALWRRLAGAPAAPDASDADIGRLAAAVFAELDALHRAAGRRLVLVHLPVEKEWHDDASAAQRAFVAQEAARLGVPFLDGVEALRRLPPSAVAALFFQPGDAPLATIAGHYTARGNQWAAEWILAELRARGVLPP